MITLQKVQKSYPMGGSGKLLPVLDIQEFVVPEGSRMAVAGPSGSGKTTLFHIIAGILAPTSGRVQVAGTDLTELRRAERDRFRARHIGYVFQSFNLLRAFTALENVMLGMVFAGARPPTEQHARAVELLERVGLGHRLGHKPTQLSNGEQQRVAVARALANRPRILLADEPSAHLDFETAERVTELLWELCAEGGVILIVATHDPRLLRTFEHVVQMQAINRVLREGGVA
jgi:ABC-type lipoprotein export system ATPase subunit